MSKSTRGRKRTGSLYWTKSGWRARVTVDVDGVAVQKSINLETLDKTAARVKLKRWLEQSGAGVDVATASADLKRVETFREAAERIVNESGIATKDRRLERLHSHVYPAFGGRLVTEVKAGDVREVLKELAAKGYSWQQCEHVRRDVSYVLGELWRLDELPENVCKKVRVPNTAKVDTRERAVLTDEEFLGYLRWRHPDETADRFVLERQVQSCLARVFGGQRWGDVLTADWSQFTLPDFERGWVARRKTKAPQTLVVPEALRPLLKAWHRVQGQPTSGLMFPVRIGERAGEARSDSSIANLIRRDMMRAFGIEDRRPKAVLRRGRRYTDLAWTQVREMTPREKELFLPDQPFTKPVDFHSFRRGFKQALADGNVDVQLAMKVSGATDMAAHQRYLQNTRKVAEIPAAAVPDISMAVAGIRGADSYPSQKQPEPGNVQCATPAERSGNVTAHQASKRLVLAGFVARRFATVPRGCRNCLQLLSPRPADAIAGDMLAKGAVWQRFRGSAVRVYGRPSVVFRGRA